MHRATCLLFPGAAAAVSAMSFHRLGSAHAEESEAPAGAAPAAQEEDLPVPTVIGVFLGKEAHEKMQRTFGVKFTTPANEPIPLLVDPTKQQAEDLRTLCGR